MALPFFSNLVTFLFQKPKSVSTALVPSVESLSSRVSGGSDRMLQVIFLEQQNRLQALEQSNMQQREMLEILLAQVVERPRFVQPGIQVSTNNLIQRATMPVD